MDVVRTITLDLPQSKFHSAVKSVTAPATMRGSVYVETDDAAAVSYLHSRVAFVLQHFPPEHVPVADYVPLVFSKSPALMSGFSWARVKRKGPYCGRLAWIQDADPYRCCYELWLVPSIVPSETFEDPFDLTLRRYYTLDGDIIPANQVPFTGGLLMERDIPFYCVIEEDPCPTIKELEHFAANRLFFDGSPPINGEALYQSIQSSKSLLQHNCEAIRGDQVHVIAGERIGCVGTVLTADHLKLTVEFSSPPRTKEEIARSAVVYKLYPGDLVDIIRGKRQAQQGWIISIDWAVRVASVVSHDFSYYTGPFGPSASGIPTNDLDEVRFYFLFPAHFHLLT